ncbi:MAG: MOSC N-terminal beta barrel domain-containing protein [Planctomycetes bacterium]|nr:MOSC N-terminal beta barrel domain-containing protein [Planctomycetota bacterium]MBI3847632.1 MOSC N-terminal beta barrel domain-containing protein [Planctomycetota bacterium]
MWIAELWRYPVKSMAGERLQHADVRRDGIAGDRIVHVEAEHGRVITARTHPALLGHHAVLGKNGEPVIDGRPWTSPEVVRDVEVAAGAGARLVRFDGLRRFDVLPLLVATDGTVAAFGHDGRRLRPNIVIGGVTGLAERDWEGQKLRGGSTLIQLRDLRQRCVMTTFDPDTLAQDVSVLRKIHREFDGRLALNASVLEPGTVAVGDPVTLIDDAGSPRSGEAAPED